MQRRERIRRWLKPVLALPGTVESLKVWVGWLAKAWAWLLVVAPVPTYWVRGWLVDRVFEVAVVGASFVVSAYGVRMLRALARRPDPEVERLKALVPRIREARDTYYRTGPGEGLRFISLTVELSVHLEALGVLCPEEPEGSSPVAVGGGHRMLDHRTAGGRWRLRGGRAADATA